MIQMLLQFAYMPDFPEIDSNLQVSVVSGVGFDTSCISENPIAAYIGLKRCKELFFLLSFLSYNYTSSFFHAGKVKFWDSLLKNSVVFETFLLYSNRPTLPLTEENFKVIESFLVSLYVTELDVLSSADIARYQIFQYCGNSEIQLLPPARDALMQ